MPMRAVRVTAPRPGTGLGRPVGVGAVGRWLRLIERARGPVAAPPARSARKFATGSRGFATDSRKVRTEFAHIHDRFAQFCHGFATGSHKFAQETTSSQGFAPDNNTVP
eukprot:1285115-Prymnesium_polylepis.1